MKQDIHDVRHRCNSRAAFKPPLLADEFPTILDASLCEHDIALSGARAEHAFYFSEGFGAREYVL